MLKVGQQKARLKKCAWYSAKEPQQSVYDVFLKQRNNNFEKTGAGERNPGDATDIYCGQGGLMLEDRFGC